MTERPIIPFEDIAWTLDIRTEPDGPGKGVTFMTATNRWAPSINVAVHRAWPPGQEAADVEADNLFILAGCYAHLGQLLRERCERLKNTGQAD